MDPFSLDHIILLPFAVYLLAVNYFAKTVAFQDSTVLSCLFLLMLFFSLILLALFLITVLTQYSLRPPGRFI